MLPEKWRWKKEFGLDIWASERSEYFLEDALDIEFKLLLDFDLEIYSRAGKENDIVYVGFIDK